MATISALYHYPVKGCAGIRVPTGTLGRAGLAHDRRFLVTDLAGTYRTQRRDPLLATVQPALDAHPDADRLTLSAPGAGAVRVSIDTTAPRRPVTLFHDTYTGIDQGEEVATWLTAVLGKPSRLVLAPPEHHRVTDGLTPGTSGYADSCPVHLLSTSSLRALNARITANGAPPIPTDRFRPNIVVDDWEAHEEDHALRLTTGAVELGYAKPAIRCVVTTVDQLTGNRSGPEPLRTLATYRRTPDGVAFGAKYAVLQPGRIAVGDVLTTVERSEADLSGLTRTTVTP
ncbi:MOSC N-terminal beta barrel domain-containing protein [Actinosynnema sp. NPDC050801]|uniref:MOSC domain-containing protein n=1 Tax=unclassified Actinosynnema TaxID=2637065 RepID=UPI0033C08E0F